MAKVWRRLPALMVWAAVLCSRSGRARADPVIARSADRPGKELGLDLRAPVRAGWGYSRLLRSRVLSLSFEDEVSMWRLSQSTRLDFVFGIDGQRTLGPGRRRSFLGTELGFGLSARAGARGPLLAVGGTIGPLWHSSTDSTKLVGFGVALRAESYPFYQSIAEAIQCRRGTFATYVLSGLNGWAQVRQDWMGSRGPSYAVGFGLDLGRELFLPVLGAILHESCAR